MEKELVVNHEEMLEYIEKKLFLDKKIIDAVLEAEMEFLNEKGIAE